jgi:hypothetical protein
MMRPHRSNRAGEDVDLRSEVRSQKSEVRSQRTKATIPQEAEATADGVDVDLGPKAMSAAEFTEVN